MDRKTHNDKEQAKSERLRCLSLGFPNDFVCSESSTTIATKPRNNDHSCELLIIQNKISSAIKANFLQKKILINYFASLMIKSQVELIINYRFVLQDGTKKLFISRAREKENIFIPYIGQGIQTRE